MDEIQQICFNAGAPVAATTSTVPPPPPPSQRKRRRQQIADDDDVDVIALSKEEITAKHMFLCDLCDKGFIREQNLLLHRRAHDLPYVRSNRPDKSKDDEKRKVYVCPETTCAHHDRPNALCDLTSLKKHYKRRHGEKTMSCTKCFRIYAVEGDLRAHLKICGTKKYDCQCGSNFSRRDSYMAHKIPCNAAFARNSSSLRNEFQSGQTAVGNLSVPTTTDDSISFFNKQPIFSSNTTTSAHSFPFLSGTIVAPPVSNLFSSNLSVHPNSTTTDPANNISIQGSELNDNIFDVNVLHDRFFGVSSVPATALPQEAPQGLTLADSGTSASFLGSSGNSTTANFGANIFNVDPSLGEASGYSHFPVFESLSGTYENPNRSRYYGNNIVGNVLNLQGDYKSSTVNENIFSTSLEDKAMQNGGLSGFGVDQINQEEQLPGHRVGGDANFPVLQDDFNFWENWGN